jgi:nephrocystin-3
MANPAAADANSREIRVFISSTFRDFMEERELLAKQVFPALNRRARERGVELVEVDLRWGVTQEQVEDGHALEICLKEIERCRPYFIGMLGDSYGSLPQPPEADITPLQHWPWLEERPWLEQRIGSASYTDLEIEHSLQVLRDPAMEGRAFFYFRKPTYSDQKANAGEEGWRSDSEEEREKLQLLRDRIRNSGFPLKEGLGDPQAIAAAIESDLWTMIDRLFPDEDQPDLMAKEARKHADYRRSRTGSGQYIGGEAYIEQLERWLDEGQQQILITGASGSGKSALIANWMERHAQSHPADVVYAHHLGCTNDANALRPLLGRLIETASAQLLKDGLITEALHVPDEWWQLVHKVDQTLKTLSEWCQNTGKLWIWILDGLDRLDPEDQKALPWLPTALPSGIHIVASALDCTAKDILNERSFRALVLKPLEPEEQELLIRQYLGRYTKDLDSELLRMILSHQLRGSPLFLKVLLEELRQCGRYDILRKQVEFYLASQTVDDLYERILERLEAEGNAEAVEKVMTSLWASRAGLSETELLAITRLAPLQWAPIDLAFEKAFGRNGSRLVFDHDYLRKAVEDRYVQNDSAQAKAHFLLAKSLGHYGSPAMYAKLLENVFFFDRWCEEYPWQLMHAKKYSMLRRVIFTRSSNLMLFFEYRGAREVLSYWLLLIQNGYPDDLEDVLAKFAREELLQIDQNFYMRWGRYPASQLASKKELSDMLGDVLQAHGKWGQTLIDLRTYSLNLFYEIFNRAKASFPFEEVMNLSLALRMNGKFDKAIELLEDAYEKNRVLLANNSSVLDLAHQLVEYYIDTGELDTADKILTECELVINSQLFVVNRDDIMTLYLRGRHRSFLGLVDESVDVLERAFAAANDSLGRDAHLTRVIAHCLSLQLGAQGEFMAAENILKMNIEVEQRNLGKLHCDTLFSILALASLRINHGKFMEAKEDLLTVYHGLNESLGELHFQAGSTIKLLASVLARLGEHSESARFWRKHIEWCDHNLPSKEQLKADSLYSLGENLFEAGSWEDALEPLYECLEARKRIHGDAHTLTLEAIERILDSLISLERAKEALILSELALKDIVKVHGRDHQKVFNQLIYQSAIHERSGDIDSAISCGQRCLDGHERLLGPEDPSTLEMMNLMGYLNRTRGEYGQSESYYLRCLEGRERLFGFEDRETLITRINLAGLLKEKGDYERAESVYRDCLDVSERLLGPEHIDTLDVVYHLAETLSAVGRRAESIPLRRRELAWSRQQNGDTNPNTLHSINQLALDLREVGELQEAETLFRELVAARQEVLEPADFYIGRALGGLAKTLAAAGKLDEALSFAQQCLNHRLEHEGEESWHTNADRLDLARVLHQLGRSSEALHHLSLIEASVTSTPELDDDYQRLLAEARELREAIEGPT